MSPNNHLNNEPTTDDFLSQLPGAFDPPSPMKNVQKSSKIVPQDKYLPWIQTKLSDFQEASDV